MPEARDRAGDRGTSKTGPSGREGGFEDGGLGASCFARGVATAATAPSTGTVGEVMPADADARAEEDSDNCTEAAGSQFRCVHGRWLGALLTGSSAKTLQARG